MDKDKKDRNREDDMQHLAHRRADTVLTIITILLAAIFIGLSAYAAIWHVVLPLMGVQTCQ